jgi:hypothetical protein
VCFTQVAGKLKLSSLPENISSWSSSDLANLGNWSVILSPVKILSLDPKVNLNFFIYQPKLISIIVAVVHKVCGRQHAEQ